jgi:hypothetical protein
MDKKNWQVKISLGQAQGIFGQLENCLRFLSKWIIALNLNSKLPSEPL